MNVAIVHACLLFPRHVSRKIPKVEDADLLHSVFFNYPMLFETGLCSLPSILLHPEPDEEELERLGLHGELEVHEGQGHGRQAEQHLVEDGLADHQVHAHEHGAGGGGGGQAFKYPDEPSYH